MSDSAAHTPPFSGREIAGWSLKAPLDDSDPRAPWLAEDDGGRLAVLAPLQGEIERIERLKRVCHPSVASVLDHGVEPLPWVALEHTPGFSLEILSSMRPLSRAQALQAGAHLADGLGALHAEGLVHGDVQPGRVVCRELSGPSLTLLAPTLERGYGDLAWAAPERLEEGVPTAATDIYSLGLVLWELLHGEGPWPEASLEARREGPPHRSVGRPALDALLDSMLAPRPAARPSAGEVVRVLVDEGAQPPGPDGWTLLRRAHHLHLARTVESEALRQWSAKTDSFALVGPLGSGRSRCLDRIAAALRQRGVAVLRLHPGGGPWAPVRRALRDPALWGDPASLPLDDRPRVRAHAAAELLLTRTTGRLAVVADDLGALDRGTALTLGALSEHRDCTVFAAASQPPGWAAQTWGMSAIGPAELRRLVEGLLGRCDDTEALAARVQKLSGGLPGVAVQAVLRAFEVGALSYQRYRWRVDRDRLDALHLGGESTRARIDLLGRAATTIGGLLATADRPLRNETLASLAHADSRSMRRALDQLQVADLVRVEEGLARLDTSAGRHALLEARTEPEAQHLVLARHLAATSGGDLVELGRHAEASGDAELIAEHAQRCLLAAIERDTAMACELAGAMFDRVPTPLLAGLRVRALAQARRATEARRFGQAQLPRDPGPAHAPLLAELARLHAEHLEEPEEALRLLQRTRLALGGSLPLELAGLAARLHLAAGELDEVLVQAATAPPVPRADELDPWIELRTLHAQAILERGDAAAALELLDNIPEDLGAGRPSRARLDALRGRLAWKAGRIREAGYRLSRAAAPEAGLRGPERARLLDLAAQAIVRIGDRPGALDRWEEALRILERHGASREAVRVQIRLADAYRETGRLEQSRESAMAALERAATRGMHHEEAGAALRMGDLHLVGDDLHEARRWYQRAATIARGCGVPEQEARAAVRMARLAVHERSTGALKLVHDAQRLVARAGHTTDACLVRAMEALCLARQGRAQQLERLARSAEEPLRSAGEAGALAQVRALLAEAFLEVGRTQDALTFADRVLIYADEMGHVQLRSRAVTLAGRCQARLSASSDDDGLRKLLGLAVAVTRERDLQGLLAAITESALALIEGDRCFVLVPDGEDIQVVAYRDRDGNTEPGSFSRSIAGNAISQGREVIAIDLGERADLRAERSIVDLDLRSVMCVPLLDGPECLGAIYVDSRTATDAELSETARYMRTLAAHAAVALANARRIERTQRELDEARGLAHDARAPLNALQAALSYLADAYADDTELVGMLAEMQDRALYARQIVERLLDRHHGMHVPVELGEVVRRVTSNLLPLARDAAVAVDVRSDGAAWVEGDPRDLARVVSNLLSNALKYSPPGSAVTLHLQAGPAHRLVVRDRGQGVPEAVLGQIFDRHVQAEGAAPGFGLGLSIARDIVRRAGGDITVRNHPDGGAEFDVRLPATEPPGRS